MGHVHPCEVWPNGAWSVQLTLSPACDLLASGNPRLFVEVLPATARPDNSGNLWYTLIFTQDGVEETEVTRTLGGGITSPSDLGGTGRSVDYLRGVRRLAERDRRRKLENASFRTNAVVAADDVRGDGSDVGGDGGDDLRAARADTGRSQRDADVVIDASFAPPLPPPLTLMRKHSSPLTLLTTATTCMREPGRLWVVVPAEKAHTSRRVSV